MSKGLAYRKTDVPSCEEPPSPLPSSNCLPPGSLPVWLLQQGHHLSVGTSANSAGQAPQSSPLFLETLDSFYRGLLTPDLTRAPSPALFHCPQCTLGTRQVLLLGAPRNLWTLPTEWPGTTDGQHHGCSKATVKSWKEPLLALPQAAPWRAAVWLLHLPLQ